MKEENKALFDAERFTTSSPDPCRALNSTEGMADDFFRPLKGKTATFLLPDRSANLAFARAVTMMIVASGRTCSIFDLDAFYSSNAGLLFSPPLAPGRGKVLIRVPKPSSRLEDDFPRLFSGGQSVVIVDTLNTLFHLLSSDEGAYRSRKFSFAVASLSFTAKESGSAIMLAMYRRELLSRGGLGRSMSSYSDVVVGVERKDSAVTMVTERGRAWEEGAFSIRIP